MNPQGAQVPLDPRVHAMVLEQKLADATLAAARWEAAAMDFHQQLLEATAEEAGPEDVD